jgi:hypothetical protein
MGKAKRRRRKRADEAASILCLRSATSSPLEISRGQSAVVTASSVSSPVSTAWGSSPHSFSNAQAKVTDASRPKFTSGLPR